MPKFVTNNEQETFAVAKEFVAQLQGGELIELIGDLGAGKTTFTKGVMQALGSEARVTSPTFSLMNEYLVREEGRGTRQEKDSNKIRRVLHLDLYRLKDPSQLTALALEDELRSDTIMLIEWPDVFDEPPFDPAYRVKLTFVDEHTREITIESQNTAS